MRRAPTAAPENVARALHGLEEWDGVTGRVAFDSAGNRVSTPVVLTVVRDGAFEYLETAGHEARAAAGGTPGGNVR
jgi:ABC-type branched-subunit amino acid transport system substrate-binding protein